MCKIARILLTLILGSIYISLSAQSGDQRIANLMQMKLAWTPTGTPINYFRNNTMSSDVTATVLGPFGNISLQPAYSFYKFQDINNGWASLVTGINVSLSAQDSILYYFNQDFEVYKKLITDTLVKTLKGLPAEILKDEVYTQLSNQLAAMKMEIDSLKSQIFLLKQKPNK
jgi:hypothetical protein